MPRRRPFKNALCLAFRPDAYGYRYGEWSQSCHRRADHEGKHRVAFRDGYYRTWDYGDQESQTGADAVIPYYQDAAVTLYHGDCRDILPGIPRVDLCLTDPPYGETSLAWDQWVDGWLGLLPTDNLWCFGSMRVFLDHVADFSAWRFAQDVVWEKHNGSGFHADRFRRIHEHVCQFYRGEWTALYKKPVTTPDAVAKTVRRKTRPTHTGNIDSTPYVSKDGGPRLQRSIIKVHSCHGYADHPTQKPVGIIIPLLEYSVPPNGVVLDPFAGADSTLDAARRLGLRSIGIEINEEWCEATAKRLSQSVLAVT